MMTSGATGGDNDSETVTLIAAANQSASLLGSAFSQSAALVVVVTQPLLAGTAAILFACKSTESWHTAV